MGIFKSSKNVSCAKSVDIPCRTLRGNMQRILTPAAPDMSLYAALRANIPLIDAAIDKIVRLTCGFSLGGANPAATDALMSLYSTVRVGATGRGLETFIATYLSELLTYGNAVGEIIPTRGADGICALYNASLADVEIAEKSAAEAEILVRDSFGEAHRPKNPALILYTALNPAAGCVTGTSLLRGLPFVSGILLNIYNTVGKNWEKAGNIRFAVTYKPQNDVFDKSCARDRAMAIAGEWQNAMSEGASKDFVAVGDVSVSVIGADAPMPDSTVPVRQLLEQIISKLGVPPYILGLSWSATERMSGEQADILTSELTAYRRCLTPVLEHIGGTYLRFLGLPDRTDVLWNDINLRDELSESEAELNRARARSLDRK